MSNLLLPQLFQAAWETVYMTVISSTISILLGMLLGIIIFTTQRKQLFENIFLNQLIGIIVNIIRSVPFIILMIAIIPFTRLVVGTSIGTNAAIVPLTMAALAFYARVAESALAEVSLNLIETAKAFGATHAQTIWKVIVPEAMPALIRGATLTVIGIIGYSTMAGAVGGGGLGELAINYGYQQFNIAVMMETVVLLIILVQLVQWFGDFLAKKRHRKSGFIFLMVLMLMSLLPLTIKNYSVSRLPTLKVGIVAGIDQKIMMVAKKVAAKKDDLNIQLIVFDDYVLPNTALNNGEIDANIFQHVPYLNAQIKARGYQLVPIAKTFIYPMGFYSRKIKSISQLMGNAVIAIPNDPSNEGRALLLLQKNHLIRLKKNIGLIGTPNDIISNPKHLQFKLLDAAQLPRVFDDATLVALTDDYVGPAGFKANDAILKEGSDSPYANVIVVRTQDKNKPMFKKLIAAMHSKEVLKATLKAFPDGAAIPAWE